jgi:hypothetical protein
MAGVSQLEEYLAQLKADAVCESSGRFTVDLELELKRLGELSRALPFRWILFACQAAVAVGASEIRLSSGLKSDSIRFELEGDPLEHFPPTLFERVAERAEAAFLRSAFEWALAARVDCSLLVEGPRAAYMISRGKSGTQRLECRPSGHRCVVLVAGRPAQPWWKLGFGRVEQSAALLVECRWRLAFCPIPVWLDGLSVASGRTDWLPGLRPPVTMQQIHLCWEQGCSRLALEHPCATPSIRYAVGGTTPAEGPARSSFVQPRARLGWLEVVPAPGRSMGLELLLDAPDGPDWCLGQWGELEGMQRVMVRGGSNPELAAFAGQRIAAQGTAYYHGRSLDRFFPVHYGMVANPIELSDLGTEAWSVVWADDEFEFDASGLELVRSHRALSLIENCQQQIRQTQLRVARRWRMARDSSHSP